MDIEDRNAEPYTEHIRLPDTITTGRFDADGRETDRKDANLIITVRDTAFMWGIFRYKLKARELGCMVFTNVPGTFLVGVSFNEWDERKDEPRVGDPPLQLVSAQRGEGVARVIGYNASDREVAAAAGIVVADYASYLPRLRPAQRAQV
jgi:hypothetical protein